MSVPVSLPQLLLEVDGRPLDPTDANALAEVRVHQGLSLPAMCELSFLDPAGALLGSGAVRPGAALRVGVEGQKETLFEGQITAVDYAYGSDQGRLVRLRGYDLLHRLRKRQSVAIHLDLDPAGLARALTADLGVSVQAQEAGPLHRKLVQYHETDLEFLTSWTERCGLYFNLRGNVLQLFTLEGSGDAALPLRLGSSLLQARVEVNTDRVCDRVETTAWDPWRVERRSGHAEQPRSGRRISTSVSADQVGGTGERRLVGEVVQSDAEAEALAQAVLDRREAGSAVLWGIAEGDSRLRPGTPVEVAGLANALDGRYLITAVKHLVDSEHGFVSEIDTAPPEARPRDRTTLATWGLVSQVDDPEGLGRVRVTLPNYSDIESDWLEVVIPGAGPDKGLIALPEVDDRVLVLLLNADPAQAVVLGGLYGPQAPPDAGVEGGAVRRYSFITPGGQRVRLDDDEETVRIENSQGLFLQLARDELRMEDANGSFVELTPQRCRIHAAAGLEIEAPGQPITISGRVVDFKRAS